MEVNKSNESCLADQLPAADSTSSSHDNEKSPSPAASLEKKDRRRLKKLRKKWQQDGQGIERSGFLNKLEWMEYQRLESCPTILTSVGPAIRRRKRQSDAQSKKVIEGAHHRNILACLLKSQIQNHNVQQPTNNAENTKKRSRTNNDDDPFDSASFPGWANFHNPGSIEHIVVLELRVSNLDEYTSKINSALEGCQRKTNCLSIPTKWFQESSTPKSSSDSLMYFVSAFNKSRNKMIRDGPQMDFNKDKIVEKVQTLTLSEGEMANEDYPIAVTGTQNELVQNNPLPTSTTLQEPSSFAIDDATSLVKGIGVQIENQVGGDNRLYVCTQQSGTSDDGTNAPRIIGLDCEMVNTATYGKELARITMVEFQDFQNGTLQTSTILDALVKPYDTITDYVTEYSGITAELLEDITTRLEQVQVALVQFLRPNDILIGHSLENDLHALHYIHPNVIDTSVLFRQVWQRKRRRGMKYSLKHLTSLLLQRKIQTDSHCSEQDAIATLELAIRRAWIGDSFCIHDQRRKSLLGYFPKNESTIGACIGPGTWLKQHVTSHSNGIHALDYRSVSDCQKAMTGWLTGRRRAQLVWSLLDIESTKEDVSGELETLVSDLASKIPPTTILLVAMQQSYQCTLDLGKKRRVCQDPRSCSIWTPEQEKAWVEQVDKCRSGVALWIGANNEATASVDKEG